MVNTLAWLFLSTVASAFPTSSSLDGTQLPALDVTQLEKRQACSGNTATTRSEWCGYNTETNWYSTIFSTGVTRYYTFDIQNITLAPDGVPRQVQAINGQIPGPTIEANWGDTISVTVTNQVQNNGTSLHFHGLRQLNTNPMDGVSSITQCPVAPGQSITYTWQATQYGSSWYHSHFSLQAWDGVFGPIVINGPATANYDEDLGPVIVQDWSHQTTDELYQTAQYTGKPPAMDNGLINGMNVYGDGGSRWTTTFEAGKTYRLRLVNAAVDSFFAVSLDNHTMTVIAADFVPINPYETTTIHLGIGQRYDVLITANQEATASSFWLRAVPDSFCSVSSNPNNIMGIVNYASNYTSSSTPSEPTTSAWPSLSEANNCYGELDSNIVPALPLTVAPSLSVLIEDMEFKPNSQGLQRWYLDGSTFFQPWDNPMALELVNGVEIFNASQNVIITDLEDEWHYLVVETVEPFAHPIHLHGHDFYVLAKGAGSYPQAGLSGISMPLNPPRRDTEMLPAEGWLLIAFQSDNPGAWVLHCHIGWHQLTGFSMQILDQMSKIAGLYSEADLEATCGPWSEYYDNAGFTQKGDDDDGI